MTIYQGIVLECQHCYMICRYTEAMARHNCPACGLTIANWDELTAAIQAKAQQSPDPSSPG
jgi:hypothetical protein